MTLIQQPYKCHLSSFVSLFCMRTLWHGKVGDVALISGDRRETVRYDHNLHKMNINNDTKSVVEREQRDGQGRKAASQSQSHGLKIVKFILFTRISIRCGAAVHLTRLHISYQRYTFQAFPT